MRPGDIPICQLRKKNSEKLMDLPEGPGKWQNPASPSLKPSALSGGSILMS